MGFEQSGANRLSRFGELLLATLMVYSADMHYRFAPFVAGIVPPWMPWRLFWAYFTGAALLAAGLSIAARKQVRLSATLLGFMLFLFLLLIHTPSMVRSILQKPEDVKDLWSLNGTGGVNNALKDFGLTVSALILATAHRAPGRDSRTDGRTLKLVFAIVMILFGLEHFAFTRYTPGIPSWSFVTFWIPWRLFWGYATGAILLVAGMMLLAEKTGRRAAVTLGWMILVSAVATYLFRMLAHVGNLGELTNTLKDVALAGGAFVLAGTLDAESVPVAVSSRTYGPSADEMH